MPKKILIAEDDFLLSYLLVHLIRKTGGKVVAECRDGRDVLNQFIINHPDLIIMDIFLYGSMTGIEVMQEIRKKSAIPVLFISGQPKSMVAKELSKIKNAFFLGKPFDYNGLKKMIEQVFDE